MRADIFTLFETLIDKYEKLEKEKNYWKNSSNLAHQALYKEQYKTGKLEKENMHLIKDFSKEMRKDITYHRSKIVPFDDNTIVYWWEDKDGNCGDMSRKDIPEGAIIREEN